MKDLHVVMTDASCYESLLRYPTNEKLLWESIEWIYGWIVGLLRELKVRRPRSKYDEVRKRYMNFSRNRKKGHPFCSRCDLWHEQDREYCSSSPSPIYTGFVRKGKKARDEDQRSKLRSLLSKERSTRLEGSFGTEKEHYNLRKIKARTEETEILWILFGVHTANAVRLAGRQQ